MIISVLTVAFGLQHYDWQSMLLIRQGDDHELAADAHMDVENTRSGQVQVQVQTGDGFEVEQKKLLRASKISKCVTVVLT